MKTARVLLFSILFLASLSPAMADRPNPVASRIVGGNVLYYFTLHEAIEAVPALPTTPDEITLLADITLHTPLIVEDGKHIRLVAGDGNKTIMRGDDLLGFPVIWVKGENASLSLGMPNMEYELIIDGGYLTASEGSPPPIIANAPLAAVSGPDSKLIMYDGVTLQNNCNAGNPQTTSYFENGAGVFIRTSGDLADRLAEFIMKGGVIQGNINKMLNNIPCGGGVLGAGFGSFVMEGGVVRNNTAYRSGGGVHFGSRASFRKTGGVIYGKNAPENLRNIVIDGYASPKIFGHAVFVALLSDSIGQFRDDTVGENDHLSYIGHPAENGIFGKEERWDHHNKIILRRFIFSIVMFLSLSLFLFFFISKRARQKRLLNIDEMNVDLTDHEKKVFDLLLTDLPVKVIADNLDITYAGVAFHNRNIYRKLKVKNRTELLIKYKSN